MKAIVGSKEYEINLYADDLYAFINGREVKLDWYSPAKGLFHFLYLSKSYNAEIVYFDEKEKYLIVKLNNKRMEVHFRDESDELLEKLGITPLIHKTGNIKAPMPGLVLEVLVKAGDSVTKNDGLVVLEAMKMENLIKPPSEGVIKAILVSKGMKVEKNQVLIEMEDIKN